MAVPLPRTNVVIERCETGIPELDQILRGGIPRGNVVLLAGGSGMGKTTMTLEFLAHGAERDEPGLFMSVTEPLEILRRNASEYLFMQPEFFDKGLVRLVDLRAVMKRMDMAEAESFTFEDTNSLVEVFEAVVKEYGIKRLVVDSVTAICQRIEHKGRIRDFIFQLGLTLSELDCTTILTSETPPRKLVYSMFGVEEFIADGIIFLSEMERHNDLLRTLQVMKMRGTDHSRAKFMLDLSEFGISLAPLLKKFGDTGVQS